MKYKLYWIEWHNPDNRLDDDEVEAYSLFSEKAREIGIQRIMQGYKNTGRNAKHTADAGDGWAEFEITVEFEANNIAEARDLIFDFYDGSADVYTLYDENGKTIFTEEDWHRKIKRDIVISSTDKGDLVGVYFEDTNGKEVLTECSPEEADKIIEIWNKGV